MASAPSVGYSTKVSWVSKPFAVLFRFVPHVCHLWPVWDLCGPHGAWFSKPLVFCFGPVSWVCCDLLTPGVSWTLPPALWPESRASSPCEVAFHPRGIRQKAWAWGRSCGWAKRPSPNLCRLVGEGGMVRPCFPGKGEGLRHVPWYYGRGLF